MKYNILVAVVPIVQGAEVIRGYLRNEHMFENAPNNVELLRSSLIKHLADPAPASLVLYTLENAPMEPDRASKTYQNSTVLIPPAVLANSAVQFQIVEVES